MRCEWWQCHLILRCFLNVAASVDTSDISVLTTTNSCLNYTRLVGVSVRVARRRTLTINIPQRCCAHPVSAEARCAANQWRSTLCLDANRPTSINGHRGHSLTARPHTDTALTRLCCVSRLADVLLLVVSRCLCASVGLCWAAAVTHQQTVPR